MEKQNIIDGLFYNTQPNAEYDVYAYHNSSNSSKGVSIANVDAPKVTPTKHERDSEMYKFPTKHYKQTDMKLFW